MCCFLLCFQSRLIERYKSFSGGLSWRNKNERRTVEQMLKRFNICTCRGINIALQVVVVMKGPYSLYSQPKDTSQPANNMLIDPCTGHDKRWWWWVARPAKLQTNFGCTFTGCLPYSCTPTPATDIVAVSEALNARWGLYNHGGGAGSGRSVVCARLEDN